MRMMMRMLRCSLPLALAVAVLGCRDGKIRLPTAPVSGSVTYKGKPLSTGRIIFFHSSGQMAGADIGADGAFKLTAYQGKNSVQIECFSSYSREMTDSKSFIPLRYANYSTSELTFEVKPDENNKAEFALKD